GISLWVQSWAAAILWLAPMLAMKGVHQLQNTIEHLGLPHEDNVLVNTRSTRTNAFMRWLGWQMQYHTAHHAFPGVPFHRLRELHEAIFTSRGASVHDVPGLSNGSVARLRPRQDGSRLFRRSHLDCRSAAWLAGCWFIK